MSSPRLTNTSFVVLGLVEVCQPVTPYDMKRFAEISVFHFWTVPHTQIYSECARLAGEGLLDEELETAGRRRRTYRLTETGRAALDEWRAESSFEPVELRDPGLIKLFFGADPKQLALVELEGHERKLQEFEELRAGAKQGMVDGMALSLDAGIACERAFVQFWRNLAGGKADSPR